MRNYPSHANSKNAVLVKYLMDAGEVYSSAVQIQSDIASHYNYSIFVSAPACRDVVLDALFVRSYVVVHIFRNAHARVMEAENSITLAIYIYQWTRIYSTGMALRNDYGFS